MTTTHTPQENIQATEGDPETKTTASFPVIEEENDTNVPNGEGEDEPRKRHKSSGWEHIEGLLVDQTKGEPLVKCKYCLSTIACHTTSHGTNEMQKHVRMCPENPNRANKLTQSSFSGSLQGSTKSVFYQDRCRKALAKFLILDGMPLRTVEGEGFKELLRELEPRFQIPSSAMVIRDCLKLYLEEARNLKRYFKNSRVRVSLTTDIWTSTQSSNYMCLIAHWIDEDWTYQKRILNFRAIENHKGDTIVEEIEKCLLSWSIDKVFTITVDNTSSDDTVVASLKRVLKHWNNCDGDFLHLRCCARILNLVVSDTVKDMHKCIEGIRNAIKYVRSSLARFRRFKELAEKMKIDSNSPLSMDCSSRWDSTYKMLVNAIKFSSVFERMQQEDKDYISNFLEKNLIGPPDTLDWKDAKDFVIFLKAFYRISLEFSGSLDYLTSNLCFHHIVEVSAKLNKCANSHNSLLCNMAKRMQSKYKEYWGNLESLNPLLLIAVVLDPRCKMKFLKYALKLMFLDDVQCEAISKKVSDALYRLYDHYSSGLEMSQTQSQSQTQVGSESSSLTQTLYMCPVMRRFIAATESEKPTGKYAEVEKYLKANDSYEARDPEFDILTFWKVNATEYKVLSLIARDVLAMSVCSVSSESVFNTGGGRVIDEFKSSLSVEMVEAFSCVQNWLSPSTSKPEGLDCDNFLSKLDYDNFNDTEKAIHGISSFKYQ